MSGRKAPSGLHFTFGDEDSKGPGDFQIDDLNKKLARPPPSAAVWGLRREAPFLTTVKKIFVKITTQKIAKNITKQKNLNPKKIWKKIRGNFFENY